MQESPKAPRPEWAKKRDAQWEKIKERARKEAVSAVKAERGAAEPDAGAVGPTPLSATISQDTNVPADGPAPFPQDKYDRAMREAEREAERSRQRMESPVPTEALHRVSASAMNRWADERFSPMHGEEHKMEREKPAIDLFASEPTTFTWTPEAGSPVVEDLYYPSSTAEPRIKNPSIGRAIKKGILALSALVTSLFAAPAPLNQTHFDAERPKVEGSSVAGDLPSQAVPSKLASSKIPNLLSEPKLVRTGVIPTETPETTRVVEPTIDLSPVLSDKTGTEAAGYLLRDVVRQLGGSLEAQRQAVSLPRAYLLRGKYLQEVIGIPGGKHTARTIPGSVRTLMLNKLYGKEEVRERLSMRASQLKLPPADIAALRKAIEKLYEASRSE